MRCNANAQAEAARQQVLAAKADLERIQAQLKAEQEKAKRDADAKAAKLASEANRRDLLSQSAVAFVQRSGSQILTSAYPLALGGLTYRNAELLGVATVGDGYSATVRLNYLNLFNRDHYLEITFSYDPEGNYRSWKFVGHSDIIAPKELTFGTLIDLSR